MLHGTNWGQWGTKGEFWLAFLSPKGFHDRPHKTLGRRTLVGNSPLAAQGSKTREPLVFRHPGYRRPAGERGKIRGKLIVQVFWVFFKPVFDCLSIDGVRFFVGFVSFLLVAFALLPLWPVASDYVSLVVFGSR